MIDISPNNGLVSPNTTYRLDVSSSNQRLDINNGTSDNDSSSPNNGLVSPNITYGIDVSFNNQRLDINNGTSNNNSSFSNTGIVSPKGNVDNYFLVN